MANAPTELKLTTHDERRLLMSLLFTEATLPITLSNYPAVLNTAEAKRLMIVETATPGQVTITMPDRVAGEGL